MRACGILLCILGFCASAACGRAPSESPTTSAEARAGGSAPSVGAPGLIFGDEDEFPAEEPVDGAGPGASDAESSEKRGRAEPVEQPPGRVRPRPSPLRPLPPNDPGWFDDLERRLREARRELEEEGLAGRGGVPSYDPEFWCGTGRVHVWGTSRGGVSRSPGRWQPTEEKGIYRRVVWARASLNGPLERAYEYGRRKGDKWETWSAAEERERRAKLANKGGSSPK